MQVLHKKMVWGLSLAGILASGVAILAVGCPAVKPTQHLASVAAGAGLEQNDDSESGAITVKTICPKCDPSYVLSVTEPATVMPYYLSELDAQVTGPVETIRKAEGAKVKAGELLAKIWVPDLYAAVELKKAILEQRQKELEMAQKNVQIAKKAVAVAADDVKVQEAGVDAANAIRNYREKVYNRLKKMLIGDITGTTQEVVDEHEQYYLGAVADVIKAKNSVLKAKSDLAEANAKLEAANADVKLKEALIKVAGKDRDKAQALADYSQVRSSYNGLIKRRHVDPGSFVRIGDPVLTVQRTDIVTVTMKVPDTYAPYISQDTEAVIEMDDLPGLVLEGKVTRAVPSLLNKDNDHTMLVEVDLYNGTREEYQAWQAGEEAKKVPYDDLKEGPLPLYPKVTNKAGSKEFRPLIPGYYGQMRLDFQKLPNLYLVPSDAIMWEGGTPFLFLVQDGKARKVQVDIPPNFNDQKVAKVSLMQKRGNEEVKRNLTGNEVVICSNLSELSDRQPVKTIAEDWTPQR